ncbi:MAG: hypothetical protein MR019_02265 [Ruminococcus sp.]|nr:hypothetical protein [Ruminococcus sp.]MDY3895365.1 hypothetical protein [Candidatus Fimenecus sp.]
MNKKDVNTSYGKSSGFFAERTKTRRKSKTLCTALYLSIAFVICVAAAILIWRGIQNHKTGYRSTLPGAEKVYPTVMVDGSLYEWYKGAAICDDLPQDCVFYGDIKYVAKKTPKNDCEFSAAFDAEGQIYKVPDEASVYLVLTTYWLSNTVVKFDAVSTAVSELL